MSARVLGRGIAALIRDIDTDNDANTNDENESANSHSHLTPPELRERIRERLAPFFDHDSDTRNLNRKIESIVNPVRNDLTLSSFSQLRDGKLYTYDTKRMHAFRSRKP